MKKPNRRKFITAAAALAAGSAVSGMPRIKEKKKLLVHHAVFWLKNPTSTEDRDKLAEGVKGLGKIETIRELHVGIVASTEKRDVVDTSWGVSEVMFFDDLAGQATYQTHAIHQAFIKEYSHLWEKVIVYDAIDV